MDFICWTSGLHNCVQCHPFLVKVLCALGKSNSVVADPGVDYLVFASKHLITVSWAVFLIIAWQVEIWTSSWNHSDLDIINKTVWCFGHIYCPCCLVLCLDSATAVWYFNQMLLICWMLDAMDVCITYLETLNMIFVFDATPKRL